MKRRDFIPRIMGGSAIVAVLPMAMTSCEKDDMEDLEESMDDQNENDSKNDDNTIDLDDASYVALKTQGGSAYKGDLIVINLGMDEFAAFSSECTHSGCTVNYDKSNNNLLCPCHRSLFSLTGSVLRGPATQALKKYTVKKEGNVLTIS